MIRRRVAAVAILLAVSAFPLLAAEPTSSKRRSTTPRSPGPAVTAEVSGTVTDVVTGKPVINVRVNGGRRSDHTDASGRYSIKNAEGFGSILLEAERSGYKLYSTKLNGAGPFTVDIKLQPTPTVSVKKTDGTSLELDFEDLRFGYPVPFLGYRAGPSETFCFPDAHVTEVNKSEMRKLTGPGVTAASACCTNRNAMKINLLLKNGQGSDVYFVDSCELEYTMELIGTIHDTGASTDIPFADIAEVVFP
jgi:hypothetical protein